MLSAHKVEIPCSKCGHKMPPIALGELRKNPQLTCSNCGLTFSIDASGFNQSAAEAQRATDDFASAISKV